MQTTLLIIAVVIVLVMMMRHKGLPAKVLKEKVDGGALVIDVRRSDEYTSGHVRNAKHYPLQSLEKKMAKLPKDRDIIVYCLSDGRSAQAVSILKSNGFTKVFNGGGYANVQAALGE
jgi:phage shock protein E